MLYGNMVSGNYFDVARHPASVRPLLHGRGGPHPGVAPGASSSRTRSGNRSSGLTASVIGRSVLVNGNAIHGRSVSLPQNSAVSTPALRADAWVPLMMQPQLRPRANLTSAIVAVDVRPPSSRRRDDPGTTGTRRARHTAAMDEGEQKGPAGFRSIRVAALSGFPGGEGAQMLGFLSVLLGAASLVLLIAGVNVAAMLSARSVARQREFAVRAALGAGRTRLVRQLLTEILLLFAAGALGGIAVAVLATTGLEQISLPANIPLILELSPDLRVFSFALAVSLLTGLIFGLAPALRAARQDITSRLRADTPGSGAAPRLMNRALVVGQLALSLVLLVSAGLCVRALSRGEQIDPGFDLTGVTTAAFEPESWGYERIESARLLRCAARTR